MFNRAPLWSSTRTAVETAWKGDQARAHQVALLAKDPSKITEVVMHGLNGSKLAISWLPTFRYQPQWSWPSPLTRLKVQRVEGSRLYVTFVPTGTSTPAMACNTCFVEALWPLPVPALPPGVKINIGTKKLEGWLDLGTGEISLDFVSEFTSQILWWKTRPLDIVTKLTTGEQTGQIFHAVGERIRNGLAKLVAISRVPLTPDNFQNVFLRLPTDALTIMRVKFDFVTSNG